MNLHKVFSELHPGNIEPLALAEIQADRSSSHAFICGNGPSLNKLPSSIISGCDLIGTIPLACYAIKPKWIFYESLFIVGGIPEMMAPYTEYMMSTYMSVREASSFAQQLVDTRLLLNPQFPQETIGSQYAYYNPIEASFHAYLPPYFIVNETSERTINNDLRSYFGSGFRQLLNLKGSMIRAVSLAFIAGYSEISIVGIDPSTHSAWYLNDDARFSKKVPESLRSIYTIRSILQHKYRQNSRHEMEELNFCNNIFLIMRIFLNRFKNSGMTIPDVKVYGSDPVTRHWASVYGFQFIDV